MSEGLFPSTRRSVLAAVQSGPSELRDSALAAIAEAYWKPACKYIRLKWKARPDDAEDLTQSFFASLLERGLLARYDPARASFRTYLRLCIDGHVSNIYRAGARRPLAPLEEDPPDPASMEDVFYREWQRQMFSLAVDDLKKLGQPVRFAIFEQYDLAAGERPSYQDLATQFELPVTSITNHLAWARRELRRCLLDRLESIGSSEAEMEST